MQVGIELPSTTWLTLSRIESLNSNGHWELIATSHVAAAMDDENNVGVGSV